MEKVKGQQELLVRDALRHKQVIKDIDKMALLAQQMQDELKSTNPDGRNGQRAAEIEKLAEDIKSVKNSIGRPRPQKHVNSTERIDPCGSPLVLAVACPVVCHSPKIILRKLAVFQTTNY